MIAISTRVSHTRIRSQMWVVVGLLPLWIWCSSSPWNAPRPANLWFWYWLVHYRLLQASRRLLPRRWFPQLSSSHPSSQQSPLSRLSLPSLACRHGPIVVGAQIETKCVYLSISTHTRAPFSSLCFHLVYFLFLPSFLPSSPLLPLSLSFSLSVPWRCIYMSLIYITSADVDRCLCQHQNKRCRGMPRGQDNRMMMVAWVSRLFCCGVFFVVVVVFTVFVRAAVLRRFRDDHNAVPQWHCEHTY